MNIFDFEGSKIELDYTEKLLDERRFNTIAKGYAIGTDYERVEYDAQFHLVERAIQRRPKHNLSKIIAIKQNIENVRFYGKSGLRINLEGIAIYKKKKN